MSQSRRGKPAPNKGKKASEEAKRKMSESAKRRVARDGAPKGPAGTPAWNKGLTAETSSSISSMVEKQRGQKRSGNYKDNQFFKNRNPWKGKSRSGILHPRYRDDLDRRDIKDFRNKVAWLTEVSYTQYRSLINPNDYPRTLAGVKGGYHLDHIFPVSLGYELGMSPEDLADPSNLQMLPWRDNVVKGNKLVGDKDVKASVDAAMEIVGELISDYVDHRPYHTILQEVRARLLAAAGLGV